VGLRGLLRGFLLLTVVVLVLMLSVAAMPVRVFAVATADEAQAAVDGVQAQIITCYGAVAEVEGAGGNVTGLAGVLNEAGALLSWARVAFENGEYDVAVEFSSNCTGMLVGFTDRAVTLRDSATHERYVDFMVNVVGSTVGAVAVVVAGWVLWIYLKRKYGKAGSAV
jgi:alkylated DNA nucleotide flippase Atl1